MKKIIYISSFCVNFRDYAFLRRIVKNFKDFELGIEYATWWVRQPELPRLLDEQIHNFQDVKATIHSPFSEICNEDATEGKKLTDERFDHACEEYHALHASSMVVHTNEGAFEVKYGQKLSIRRILELYEKLKAQGIPMTVENVGYPAHGNCIFNQKDFVELFEKLPEDIGCLIDTGHAMLNGWDIVEVIKALGPRIRGYHLNNNNGVDDSHYPCFDKRGVYSEEQMTEVIEAIARYSPDADIIVEYAPGEHITQELMHSECRRIMEILVKNSEGIVNA